MCGIAGSLVFKNNSFTITEPYIKLMRDTMVHRGPDNKGVWIAKDGRVGLGHRRLSIVDLSDAATQPMSNEDSSLWICFNGEIYNHAEIRKELEQTGNHKWKTDHSDTEVILHAFEEWGIDCLEKFRGMFAIALWEVKARQLWLIRDRIGIKPIYYSVHNGRIVFASEIKALLADPQQQRMVDEESFYHFLSFLTTPAPQTLFNGIKKLPGGTWILVREDGRIKEHRYWDVWDFTGKFTETAEKEILERVLSELRTAVNLRKVSDVPVGVFLSGGIDSSVNAALFSEDEEGTVKTFAIGYDRDYKSCQNEFGYARIMADFVSADHYEKRITMDELIDFLPKLVYHQDEPIADPVCVPVYYLSKLARENGVTVCQVGEGSDELFFGYPAWKMMLKLQKLSNLPLTGLSKKIGLTFLSAMGKKRRFYYEWLRRGTSGEPVFWGGAESFTEEEKMYLISPRLQKRFSNFSSYEVIKPIRKRFLEKADDKSALNWMSYLDLNFRLPELLLMRIDKMSMATSLEARVPFLDHKFVELAMSIPEATKFKNGELKYVLKKAVHGLLPDELIERKKQGFGIPIHEWFFDKLGDYASQKILNFTKQTDFFDKDYMKVLLKGNKMKLWYIFNFVLWHERWIK